MNGMLDSYLMNLRKKIDRLLRENGRAEPDIVQVLVADDGLRPNQSAEFLEEDGRTALKFRCGVSEEQMCNVFEFRRKAAALPGVNAVIETAAAPPSRWRGRPSSSDMVMKKRTAKHALKLKIKVKKWQGKIIPWGDKK